MASDDKKVTSEITKSSKSDKDMRKVSSSGSSKPPSPKKSAIVPTESQKDDVLEL
jgi:hypothetical protein